MVEPPCNQLLFGLNVIIIIVLLASSVWLLYLELVVIRKHTVVYTWQIGDKGVAQIFIIQYGPAKLTTGPEICY